MNSKEFENSKNNERVVDVNAEERMPAVNSAPAIVDILREAIERAADNERKKVRRELFTINAVILTFLVSITGVFLILAYNLVKELKTERNMSRDLIIAALEQTRPGAPQQDEQELSRTLRDILSAWDREKTPSKPTAEKPSVPIKDSSVDKTEPDKTAGTPETAPTPVTSPPEPTRSVRAEVEDLEAEEEAIAILISSGKAENTELLTGMIEERDKALSQLRERIKKTHSNLMSQSSDKPEPTQSATVQVEEQNTESQPGLSRYISINAAGTEMRILTPTP